MKSIEGKPKICIWTERIFNLQW